jgi:hypothetical protein
MKKLLLSAVLIWFCSYSFSQQTEMKNYPSGTYAGDAKLGYSFGDIANGIGSRIYVLSVSATTKYNISVLVNMQYKQLMKVYIDEVAVGSFYGAVDGWQTLSLNQINIAAGKRSIRFGGNNNAIPMVDEIFIVKSTALGMPVNQGWNSFIDKMRQLEQAPVAKFKTVAEAGDLTNAPEPNTVLSNPEGTYSHEVDVSFAYTHYSTVYLTAGSHTFTTSGSTINRALTVFNQSNYTYSWSNVNGGPGGESGLYLYVGLAGYYSVMLRPVTSGQTGTTNIILDGSTLVSNATIGGKTFSMPALKGGNKFLNFFTSKLSSGDTRMIVSRYAYSSARAYNDDYYSGTGDWYWGLCSRIKKNFGTDSVQYGFVCAYSPTSTGIADVYLGNDTSEVNKNNYPEFALLKPDDAIRAAPNTGMYNCIAWSGGVTSSWIWPPNQYSTYNCSNSYSDIACFDHFYANQPVRYPGAWNYTRTGATVNNAIVDLWALNGNFTHASVRKPGNAHPHGYDWESKPGGTARTFHPRNALTNDNFGYGHVVNYYIPTGTYANMFVSNQQFESDADAVKAGVAVFENASLSREAQNKLSSLLRKVDNNFSREFEQLYDTWKKTWVKNAVYSDPAMYCKNTEHDALAALAAKQPYAAMILVFNKFVNEKDHFIGELMWTLTKERFAPLLTQVKNERAEKPNDESGRYKIHGDHDNGVLYVEKILKQLDDKGEIVTAKEIAVEVSISPNPVQDRFTVKLQLNKTAVISIKAVSSQTGKVLEMLKSMKLEKGNYQYNGIANLFAGNTGDVITVQVMVDGTMKVYKALIAK